MSPTALVCPHCGGSLERRSYRVIVTCKYCGQTVSLDGVIVRAAAHRALHEQRVDDFRNDGAAHRVGSTLVRLGARIGRGESSDVFDAVRYGVAPERVVLKVLREAADAALLENEHAVLGELQASEVRGAEVLARRLPAPALHGPITGAGHGGAAAYGYRVRPGFDHDLESVRDVHGDAIDPRHLVWIWRRILETLGFVHEAGFVHGAMLPQHVVLNPRDHGALLVGFGVAGRVGKPLVATASRNASVYPSNLGTDAKLTRRLDVTMAARTVAWLIAGDSLERDDALASVPAPVRAILERQGSGSDDDARAARERVGHAAREAFGPPTFVDLAMPDPRDP